MAATREDVIEFLKSMTLLEASQLVKDLEEIFGVSAAAAAVAAPVAAAGGGEAAAPAEEKTEFDVILQAAGGNKNLWKRRWPPMTADDRRWLVF